MPWIQNVSKQAILHTTFKDPGINSMLIQIIDPGTEFPKSSCKFKEIHQFEFLDVEKNSEFSEFEISNATASKLVSLLQHALAEDMNVIVHCIAGICRSGAVAEIGVILGFEDTSVFRNSNLLVKHKMMKELGWLYDTE